MPRGIFRSAVVACAVAVFAVSTATACGDGEPTGAPRKVVQIKQMLLPGQILGLDVAKESVEKVLAGARRPYIKAVGLYSFRKEELLQATLQVSQFTPDADFESDGFRRTVAQQIVGTSSELPAFRMGDRTVYLGGNVKQSIAVWFDGSLMMVLAERAEFEQPRALLRDLIGRDLGEDLA